jgi:hypothetical protein
MIKLLAYVLLGYVAYELTQGFVYGGARRKAGAGSRSRALQNALNRGAGRLEVLTQDADGAVLRHRVGRGIIH